MSWAVIIKTFASLGVPGLAIGVLYFAIKQWHLPIPMPSKAWGGPIVVLIVIVLGGLTYVVLDRVFPSQKEPRAESQSRFDVRYDGASFFRRTDKPTRSEFRFQLVPTTKNNLEVATVFLGLVAVHDDDTFDESAAEKTRRLCEGLESCITYKKWDFPDGSPGIFVRGGDSGVPLAFSADLPSTVRRVRLRWAFYQREANNGGTCEVDKSKPTIARGLPILHVVKDGMALAEAWCFRSGHMRVIEVN